MKSIGIYGGSFNPVHFGHTGLAQWVVEHTDLDEVWLMVSPNNPLKPAGILAPEQERLAQVQAAVEHIPELKASDFEFHLPRPSYTANTLRELQKAYPDNRFTLIIGEDNWRIFDQWREHDYILSHFRIFIYPRRTEGETKEARLTEPKSSTFSENEGVFYLSTAPLFDISSTAIRRAKGLQ